MPIYEFQCQTCQTCFEEILPASRETLPDCPRCGSADAVVKQISACVTRTAQEQESCAPRGGFS